MVGISFKKRPTHAVFLEAYSTQEEYQSTHEVKVPLESLIIYCIFKYCEPRNLRAEFVPVTRASVNKKPAVSIHDEDLVFCNEDVPWQVAACVYPVAMSVDVIVTGLCDVARHICKYQLSNQAEQEHNDGILGFRRSCLQAPNEVSIWTKFCEVDVPNAVNEILSIIQMKEIPINLVRYENHLKKPVRIHNMYKVARELKLKQLKFVHQADEAEEAFAQDAGDSVKSSPVHGQGNKSSPVHKPSKASQEVECSSKLSQNGYTNKLSQVNEGENNTCPVDDRVNKASQVVEHESNSKQIDGEASKMNGGACKSNQVEEHASSSSQVDGSGNNMNRGAHKSSQIEEQACGSSQVDNSASKCREVDDDECSEVDIEQPSTSRVPKPRKWKSNVKKQNEMAWRTDIKNIVIIHQFAEGPFFTLADLVLLPSYYIIHQAFGDYMFETYLPFTAKWLRTVKAVPEIQICLDILKKLSVKLLTFDDIIVPTPQDVSLYKKDPKRHNPKKRLFTKEEDIEKALSLIKEEMVLVTTSNDFKPTFDWSMIPDGANPTAGHLPSKRVTRKTQQLENLAVTVLNIARIRDVIVDFCCGSGHLGILLAYLLPQCTIILLENKEQSLSRARKRVQDLKLRNVFFFQCNLDFFEGRFDIGIGLHACGTSDLVLDKCLKVKAKFVISPCCYGSIHVTDRIVYPRRKVFNCVTVDQYMCIAHAADQTHEDHPLALRGARCMAVIDSDRACLAKDLGYKVTLTRLKPLLCTPKNNLIIGVPN